MSPAQDKPPRQVAVAVVWCKDTHRVLMVTSRKHEHHWIFPKGGIEKGETPGKAAAREAKEEGIPSVSDEAISHELVAFDLEETPHQRRSSTWHVHAVQLATEDALSGDWLERDERERAWCSPREALARIRKWGHGGEDGDGRGSKKKKAVKMRSMERALEAFVDVYGWGGE